MKRLIKINEQYNPSIGDIVIFKNHPYDKTAYIVKNILPDGTLFIENSETAYTGISPRTVKPLY